MSEVGNADDAQVASAHGEKHIGRDIAVAVFSLESVIEINPFREAAYVLKPCAAVESVAVCEHFSAVFHNLLSVLC